MNNKCKKNFIAIIIVLSLFAIFNITAFADPFQIAIGVSGASGAGLFGSMASASGINVSYNAGTDPTQSDVLWNDLDAGINLTGLKGQKTEIDPVTQVPIVYDYLEVDLYPWLQAQDDYIDEFVTKYNVTDNSSGNVATFGYYGNYVFNQTSGSIWFGPQLGAITVGTSINVSDLNLTITTNGQYVYLTSYENGQQVARSSQQLSRLNSPLYLGRTGNTLYWYYSYNGNLNQGPVAKNSYTPTTTAGGSWTSGTVDTSVFDNWTNPTVKIPASSWSPSDPVNWSITEFLQELTSKRLAGQGTAIIIEDGGSTPPIPPVPVPSTPLGDVPYDDWIDTWGQHVITNQESGNESLDNIDTNLQTGVNTLDSIDTNIGTTNGILGQIKDLIQSGFNSITGLLNQILTKVQELVQSIVNATETLIAGILNQIPIAFQSAWNTLKQSVSIWHYVVEWVTSISNVLSWVWTMASGTSYYIILPVYASLAGAVVLALYKKFGR